MISGSPINWIFLVNKTYNPPISLYSYIAIIILFSYAVNSNSTKITEIEKYFTNVTNLDVSVSHQLAQLNFLSVKIPYRLYSSFNMASTIT